MHSARVLTILTSVAVSFAGALSGCSGQGGASDPGEPGQLMDNGFESDDPTGRSQSRTSGTESADASASAAPAAAGNEGASKDASRAIEEADIIKVEGTHLYALSRYGGLSIVDVSNPDALRVVGRKRTEGTPFEMYVRGGKVHLMLNESSRYVRSSGGAGAAMVGQWVQTSAVSVLDVSNPAAIVEVTQYDVPGSIADSRLVGDVLYLVTHENGYCWSCQQQPATIVSSFNVGGPQVTRVASLAFAGNTYTWRRSVSATNQRMYIAGPEYTWNGQGQSGSVIQVVDISDAGGKLVKGADVAVAGQINSRWQMDEHAGVLRVVSQFQNGAGGTAINPKVQTFTVASASSVTPLGSTELVLPKPEMLQSVRFDGERGYAITSERTDPLFTIDLSNPAAPKQAGELSMPGWIFHMEPRGDRLVGFGYDGPGRDSPLAVSLFDVSKLDKPTMLKRVTFGSGWSQLPEDQDRVHKAVRVLDDEGLILVPFASYGSWSGSTCSQPESGIQLIDYSRDGLALRGLAPQYGMPRRALIHGGRLLAMSDRTVTSFDITARDQPVKKHEIDLSNPSYRSVEVGSHVATVTNDWWTGAVSLALTPKDNADDAQTTGRVSLEALAPKTQGYCGGNRSVWTSWYQARLFASGSTVVLTVPVYTYDYSSTGGSKQSAALIVATLDASNPAAPKLAGTTTLTLQTSQNAYSSYGFWDGYGYYSYYGGHLTAGGDAVVLDGTRLAYLEVQNEWTPISPRPTKGPTQSLKVNRRLHVVDVADATAPTPLAAIDLGESLGSSPLVVSNGVAMTSRWLPSTKTPGKVRFYVDRVRLGDAVPQRLSSPNVPGSLVSVDELTGRLLTTDYSVSRVPAKDYADCQRPGSRAFFDYEGKACVTITRSFKLSDVSAASVTLRSTLTPAAQNFSGVTAAEDRLYVARSASYDYSTCTSSTSGSPCAPTLREPGGLWAIGGIRDGALAIVSSLDGDTRWPVAARGSKVAMYTDSGLTIYDTKTKEPTIVGAITLRGYGYTSHVLMTDTQAVCSLGEWGLQSVKY